MIWKVSEEDDETLREKVRVHMEEHPDLSLFARSKALGVGFERLGRIIRDDLNQAALALIRQMPVPSWPAPPEWRR